MDDKIKKLEIQNTKLLNTLKALDIYREKKLRRTLGKIDDEELILKIRNNILNDKEKRDKIVKAIGSNFFQDDHRTSILITGAIIGTYKYNYALLKDEVKGSLVNNGFFIENMAKQALMQILAMSECYEDLPYSKFFYNPLVSVTYSLGSLIIKRINEKKDFEKMLSIHKSKYFEFILIYLREAMNSLLSTIILLSHESYSQALGTLRTMIEQVTIISTLAHYPKCLPSFVKHNELKLFEATGKKKKMVDKYLEEHNINPNNMTLRSKYIDYGWLDSIDEFNEKFEKKMYRLKSMTKLLKLDEFYEWYANWSNYVHSNFVFVKIDWNKIVNSSVYQCSRLLANMVNLYTWLTSYNFTENTIKMDKYLMDLLNVYVGIEKKSESSFDFGMKK